MSVRIIDQSTDGALAEGDYVIVDSSAEGTRRYDLGTKLANMESGIGTISDLQTTSTNLVGAVNELKSDLEDSSCSKITYGTYDTATVSISSNVEDPTVKVNGTTHAGMANYDYRDDVIDYVEYVVDDSAASSGIVFDISSVSSTTVSSTTAIDESYIQTGMIVQLFPSTPTADLAGTYYGFVSSTDTSNNIITVESWYAQGDSSTTVTPSGVTYGVLNIKTKSYPYNTVFIVDSDAPDYHNYGNLNQNNIYIDKSDFANITSFESVLRQSTNTSMVGFSARNESNYSGHGTALYSAGMANIISNEDGAVMGQDGRLYLPYQNVSSGAGIAPIMLTGGADIDISTLDFETYGIVRIYNNSETKVEVTGNVVWDSVGTTTYTMMPRAFTTFMYDPNNSNYYVVDSKLGKIMSNIDTTFQSNSPILIVKTDCDLSTYVSSGALAVSEVKFLYNNSDESITVSGGSIVTADGTVTSFTLSARGICFVLYTGTTYHVITLG